jgi:anti-sigma factor RsiW
VSRIAGLVIERLRTLSLPRRHPRALLLSRYLEGDLDSPARRALESHLCDCNRCRRELASLAQMVQSLGSLDPDVPDHLADSIIAALRAEAEISRRAPEASLPVLSVVPDSGQTSAGHRILSRWAHEAASAVRWCLQRPQLRLTLPITVVAGVVLSMVNMGGLLMHGKIDLGVCVSCAIDFLVPFLALNLGLLMLLRLPRRTRPPAPGDLG